MELRDGETLLFTRQADYYVNFKEQAVGDFMATTERIIFKSKRNIPLYKYIEILNAEIKGVEAFNSLHFIQNGLKITLNSNQEVKFKMFDRDDVIHYIEKRILGLA